MHIPKAQSTKETKAEKPKAQDPETLAPYSINSDHFERVWKEKKKVWHNHD